jgi:hypothetical protein
MSKCILSIPKTLTFTLVVLIVTIATPAMGSEKVLYSFQGIPDGISPIGNMVFDEAGNLYGVTTWGGNGPPSCFAGSCGTVYQLKPPVEPGGAWTETVIYNFQGQVNGDGDDPLGGLLIDGAGNLYGTTAYGGTGTCLVLGSLVGCGTLFRLSPPAAPEGVWTETILHSFQGSNDGYFPQGDLLSDKQGNLYGATQFGGGFGVCDQGIYPFCGTVFELSPSGYGSWTEKVLYSFKSGADGANPNGGLIFDRQGAIYGTTYFGGNGGCAGPEGVGCGTVFRLDRSPTGSWSETVLYRFRGVPDGSNPAAGLTIEAGALYGTTLDGGNAEWGAIFRLSPPSKTNRQWTESVIFNFEALTGFSPQAALLFDRVGNIYGTASGGGDAGGGTVFRVCSSMPPSYTASRSESDLYDFAGTPDGAGPAARLIPSAGGALFSTTKSGGTGQHCVYGGCGTVYEIDARTLQLLP